MALYRKTYLCICEGQQEEMYLKHLAYLLKQMPQRVVSFYTSKGDARKLINNYTEYDNACLFDYDFNDSLFRINIDVCNNLQKKNLSTKNSKKVYHAFSNVNFDLWLVLHKEEFNRPVTSNDAYKATVRQIYSLPPTMNIKSKEAMERILCQVTLPDVLKAIERADKIRSAKLPADRHLIGITEYYDNPDLSLQEFLKVVLRDCGEI